MSDAARVNKFDGQRNAVISVSNKSGLENVAKFLISNGYKLFATTGTMNYINGHGSECSSVDELTGGNEMLGGRVKTLSRELMAGILAKRREDEELKNAGITPIDLVYVEPYDFLGNFLAGENDMTEFIDIGGITLLRAAAKNFQRVIPVLGVTEMNLVMKEMKNGDVPVALRKELASFIFEFTSMYDYAISQWLGDGGRIFSLGGSEFVKLRYGENPHQMARSFNLYRPFFEMLREGKEISFNNIIDAWTAWELVTRLGNGAASIVKHASPCGAATGHESIEKAFESDPVSAYGGILAYNSILTEADAKFLKNKFLEVVIAGGYSPDAFKILDQKKNLRILKGNYEIYSVPDIRTAGNVILEQEWNRKSDLKIEERAGRTNEEIKADIVFGWEVVKSIKSNSIAIVRDGWMISSCGGQPNRVDSVKIAIERAKGRISDRAVLISDGFFPFVDSLQYIHENGIKIVAAPMGSIRDEEVIEYAKGSGLVFVEVKERAFRH